MINFSKNQIRKYVRYGIVPNGATSTDLKVLRAIKNGTTIRAKDDLRQLLRISKTCSRTVANFKGQEIYTFTLSRSGYIVKSAPIFNF